MRKILIVIAFVVELFSIARWSSCWLFKNFFYFTLPMISARVTDAVNDNKGMITLLTHVMHNKVIYLAWGGVQILLQYWDIRFLKEFIGIIGAFGVYFALWYLLTRYRRNIYIWLLFAFCLIISLIEMFFQPNIVFVWKLVIFGGSFQLLSLLGLWQFLKPKSRKRYFFIAALLILSIFSLIFLPLSYQMFCLKI